MDHQAVRQFFGFSAERVDDLAHDADAVGLLDARLRDIEQLRRPFGEAGGDRERRKRVGRGVEVQFNALQGAAANPNGAGQRLRFRAHPAEHVHHRLVALGVVHVQAAQRDLRPGERGGAEEESRRGEVALDALLERGVFLPAGNAELAQVPVRDPDVELAQPVERHEDVRLLVELRDDDRRIQPGERRGDEQAGEVLRSGAREAGLAALERAVDEDRRAAVAEHALDARAEQRSGPRSGSARCGGGSGGRR